MRLLVAIAMMLLAVPASAQFNCMADGLSLSGFCSARPTGGGGGGCSQPGTLDFSCNTVFYVLGVT